MVTSQVLTLPAAGARGSCGASKASTAVLLRFPCKEEPRLKQASGPALNVWGSFDGIPEPTRHGVIVNEAAPAKKQSLHAAKLTGADGYIVTKPEGYVVSSTKKTSSPDGYVVSSSKDGYVVSGSKDGYVVSTQRAGSSPDGYVVSNPEGYVVSSTRKAGSPDGYVVSGSKDGYVVSGSKDGYVVSTQNAGGYVVSSTGAANGSAPAQVGACSFLTLNPGLYYHKSPPMLTYGYAVSGVPCERAASAAAVTGALDRAGAKTFPTTYSLWLKPTLPAVSQQRGVCLLHQLLSPALGAAAAIMMISAAAALPALTQSCLQHVQACQGQYCRTCRINQAPAAVICCCRPILRLVLIAASCWHVHRATGLQPGGVCPAALVRQHRDIPVQHADAFPRRARRRLLLQRGRHGAQAAGHLLGRQESAEQLGEGSVEQACHAALTVPHTLR